MNTQTSLLGLKLDVPNYQGPLDLLLLAIQDEKIDIHAISLSQITTQYLNYLKEVPTLKLNSASEYLIMAAILIELKSKKLLPQPEDLLAQIEEDEIATDLVAHLQEFKFYQGVAEKLKEKQKTFFKVYSRYHREVALPEKKDVFLVDVSLEDLVKAFQNLYNVIAVEEDARPTINVAEEISLPQRLDEVISILSKSEQAVDFEALFIRRTRVEVVVTFLAILELARQRKVKIVQDEKFGGIKIGWRKDQEHN